MIDIDGSTGEGGGQILRTALALSLVTREPLRVTGIRARRARPGLMRQHLTALRAATEIGRAEVSGAEVGSTEIAFEPRDVEPGDYSFNVGSAGSATLVLQTVLPALLSARGPSRLTLEGGTDNPLAPPFAFLDRAFLPLIRRMGPNVTAKLEARGFYPAGGGRFQVEISPAPIARLDLLERGTILERSVIAAVANLPSAIARRELDAAASVLGWEPSCFQTEVVKGSPGPGNVVTIAIASEQVTEVITAFGEKGVSAEVVGRRAAAEAKHYLDSGAPVGTHLADQLLLPMAIGDGGSFRTLEPSSHTRTHIDLLAKILGSRITLTPVTTAVWQVDVDSSSSAAVRARG